MRQIEAGIAANAVRGHESTLHLMNTGISQEITSEQTSGNLGTYLWETAANLWRKASKAIERHAQSAIQKIAHWAANTKNYVLSDEMDWVGCISFILLTASAILLNIFI